MYALKKLPHYVILFFLLSIACGKVPHRLETKQSKISHPKAKASLPNSYIVTFRSEKVYENQRNEKGIKHLMDAQCQTIWSNTAVKHIKGIANLNVEEKIKLQNQEKMRFILPNQKKPDHHNTSIFIAQVDFYNEENARTILSEWIRQDKILYYEPNHINFIFNETKPTTQPTNSSLQLKYNESKLLWWQKNIRLTEAIKHINIYLKETHLVNPGTKKFNSPLIAILDSGVDYLHPALKNQIWKNPRPHETFCGFDLYGCNTTKVRYNEDLGIPSVHPLMTTSANERCPITMFGSPSPECLHGTHVAGIIAGDPDKRVPGVCPLCKIIILKIVENDHGVGKVTDSSILKALQYIYLINTTGLGDVRLINSSFGKFEHSKTISYFLTNLQKPPLDILMIAAAGNENTSKPIFPAALNTTLAVTALDKYGQKAPYANYGHWVDIAAPGGSFGSPQENYSILSSFPGESVGLSQGTSVATPIVTGAAGLLLSIKPSLNSKKIRNILIKSADQALYKTENTKNEQHSNSDRKTTFSSIDNGSLNIESAVQLALSQDRIIETPNKKRITPHCSSFIKLKIPNQPILNTLVFFLFFLMPITLISFIK